MELIYVVVPVSIACCLAGYWLGRRRGEKDTLDRVQHHSVPLDAYSRMEFNFTPRAPLAFVMQLSEAEMIVPAQNERNRLTLSEWPVPPTPKP